MLCDITASVKVVSFLNLNVIKPEEALVPPPDSDLCQCSFRVPESWWPRSWNIIWGHFTGDEKAYWDRHLPGPAGGQQHRLEDLHSCHRQPIRRSTWIDATFPQPGHTVILMQHFAVIAGNTVMHQCCDACMMHWSDSPSWCVSDASQALMHHTSALIPVWASRAPRFPASIFLRPFPHALRLAPIPSCTPIPRHYFTIEIHVRYDQLLVRVLETMKWYKCYKNEIKYLSRSGGSCAAWLFGLNHTVTDANNEPLTSESSGSLNPVRNTYGHYAAPLTLCVQA